MTLEDTEVTEEITYVNDPKTPRREKAVLRGGSGARHEPIAAEQLTTSSQEEQRRFVIRSVVDPRAGLDAGVEMSLQEAVAAGVLDQRSGAYVDTRTGERRPIPVAMAEGLIKVEYVATTRSAERRSAVGLITLRTLIDRREFTIVGAIDALTAERVDADEARLRGLIIEETPAPTIKGASAGGTGGTFTSSCHYVIGTTGETLSLDDAVDQGWVFVEYEQTDSAAASDQDLDPEVEVNTYAVSEVVDQLLRINVPFAEAVHRGLIDRDTGDYVNNVTREAVPVADAIRRGLLKARLVDDPSALLDVDRKNAVVVQRIDKIRRNVLKGLRVISAFKTAGAERRGNGAMAMAAAEAH